MAVLGIDVGGSATKGALVDLEKGVLVSERIRLRTPERSTPEAVANTIHRIIRQLGYEGIYGSGIPGVVLHGICQTAANIDSAWIGCDVPQLFQQVTGLSNYVLNDADAVGLAESKFGAAKGVPGVVMIITLGTGIGTAICNNGVLLPNLELGHLIIRDKVAEKRASSAAKVKKNLNWKEWAEVLNEYLVILENLIWPDLFIIGGGISRNHALFFPYLKTRTKVIPAQFLNQAGIIGAAIYAHDCHTHPAE